MSLQRLVDYLLGSAAKAGEPSPDLLEARVYGRGRGPIWPVEKLRPWQKWGPQRRSLTLIRHQ